MDLTLSLTFSLAQFRTSSEFELFFISLIHLSTCLSTSLSKTTSPFHLHICERKRSKLFVDGTCNYFPSPFGLLLSEISLSFSLFLLLPPLCYSFFLCSILFLFSITMPHFFAHFDVAFNSFLIPSYSSNDLMQPPAGIRLGNDQEKYF